MRDGVPTRIYLDPVNIASLINHHALRNEPLRMPR